MLSIILTHTCLCARTRTAKQKTFIGVCTNQYGKTASHIMEMNMIVCLQLPAEQDAQEQGEVEKLTALPLLAKL